MSELNHKSATAPALTYLDIKQALAIYPNSARKPIIQQVEAALFKEALHQAKNNQTRAARNLGMNRGTFRKKALAYGLI